ncbi:MAG: hypothetical protein JW809_01335 [Pirellulales bacterium]|nr:hypothetical protein [Pirellulales bacterium]
MGIVGWVIGGLFGGAVGTAIWVGVGYATQYEVGWIAWGIGGLVGLGVRAAARENEGFAPGATATVLAIGSIVVAKFLVVHLLMADAVGQFDFNPAADPNFMVAVVADEIVQQREAAGQKVAWPPERDADDVPLPAHYPADVWAEAQRQWRAMPEDQRQSRIDTFKADLAENLGAITSEARDQAFRESFSGFDILWFVLAAVTAFKVGAGIAGNE